MQRVLLAMRSLRPSTRMLLVALSTTLIVAVSVHVFAWNAFVASFAGSSAAADRAIDTVAPPLVVGIGRTPGGAGEWITYAEVFSRMRHSLGREIVFEDVPDHSALTTLVASGQVDLALVPVVTYMELARAGDATLVAAPCLKGCASDAAVIVTAARRGRGRLEEFRGGRLLIPSGSPCGLPFVRWVFRGDPRGPEAFFRSIEETASKQSALAAVVRGRADLACVTRSDLVSWPAGTFAVVAESPRYGLPPIVARRGLDPAVVRQVRAILLSAEASGAIPAGSALACFTDASPADYAFPRELFASYCRPGAGR